MTHLANRGWKIRAFGAGVLGLALSVATVAGFTGAGARAATIPAPTVGRIPNSAWGPNGQIDLALVPDYIPATGNKGQVVGYVSKADLFPTSGANSSRPASQDESGGLSHYQAPTAADQAAQSAKLVVTVYASNLTTVVGHMYPGVGFVAEGQPVPAPSPSTTPTTVVSSSTTPFGP